MGLGGGTGYSRESLFEKLKRDLFEEEPTYYQVDNEKMSKIEEVLQKNKDKTDIVNVSTKEGIIYLTPFGSKIYRIGNKLYLENLETGLNEQIMKILE